MAPGLARQYRLPAALRSQVSGMSGILLQTEELRDRIVDSDIVVAVGDVASLTCKQLGIRPRLIIVDYKTHRDDDARFEAELGDWGDRELRVQNPAATIQGDAWRAIRSCVGRDDLTRIVVEGEEDLLAIPCFLEFPVGAKVLYGRPHEGLVLVELTAEYQDYVRGLVARFDRD